MLEGKFCALLETCGMQYSYSLIMPSHLLNYCANMFKSIHLVITANKRWRAGEHEGKEHSTRRNGISQETHKWFHLIRKHRYISLHLMFIKLYNHYTPTNHYTPST